MFFKSERYPFSSVQ